MDEETQKKLTSSWSYNQFLQVCACSSLHTPLSSLPLSPTLFLFLSLSYSILKNLLKLKHLIFISTYHSVYVPVVKKKRKSYEKVAHDFILEVGLSFHLSYSTIYGLKLPKAGKKSNVT